MTETRLPAHIAETLVSPAAYADARLFDAYRWMRANNPLGVAEVEGFYPFWAVTKHADILEISRKAGETVPIMFTGAVFFRSIPEGDLFAYRITDQCMALSMHLYTVTTQVTGAPEALPFAVATVLILAIILINATSIAIRAWLRSHRKW